MNPVHKALIERATRRLEQEARSRWTRGEVAAERGDTYAAKRQCRIAEELQASADDLRDVLR